MKIIWKSIAGYVVYEINNIGKIRNAKSKKLLSPYMRGGYENYILWSKNKPKSFLAHRLVASTFIRELSINEVVHHINDNPFNNSINNLAIMTRSEHSALHQHRKGQKTVLLTCPNCLREFERRLCKTHLEPSRKVKATFCCRKCAGSFRTNKSIKDKMRRIKKNVIKVFRRYL